MTEQLLTAELPQLSDFVASAMGLHFPPSRWGDLGRGLAATSKELGFATPGECARRFLDGNVEKNQIEILASHLTVGETYFMREPRCFRLLADEIIPELTRRRQNSDRHLRIWSAGCCSGEEAYSIAIVLHQAIPDIANWTITLLATDINACFLRKAAAGIYGRWSFRQVPAGFREQFFRPVGEDRWEVLPHIKRLVRFAPLNLVEDVYPALGNETNAMDVIFCRNVLMYFGSGQSHKVVEKLHRAQAEGGWLITGAGELSQISCEPYFLHSSRGLTHYRKSKIAARRPAPLVIPVAKLDISPANKIAEIPRLQPEKEPLPVVPQDAAALRLEAHRLANGGNLAEALACCERWVARDRLNPSGHYLRAVILQERGAVEDAVKSLRGTLYLDPHFVLAHIALGNIDRQRGRRREAAMHLENARQLLAGLASDAPLPESGGVTAGRFMEIVNSLLELEAA